MDSIALGNNITNTLGDIISSQSPVQMNSYGTGALSTASFRGTGAARTAVLWNGFNLQDVLNGQVDFNQIPAFFLDDVELQFGGCGALYGSGAIGGAVNLSNDRIFKEGIRKTFLTSFGSFGSHFEGAECSIGQKTFSSSIRAFNSGITNNFEYRNPYQPGDPKQKLENSSTTQQGALVDNDFLINKEQRLSFHVWFENIDHDIPSLMNDTAKSKQNQKDQIVRQTYEWNRTGKKADYFVRTGFFNSSEVFTDPNSNMDDDYKSLSSVSEFENNYKFNTNFKLNSGCSYTHEQGESPELDRKHERDREAAFASLKYNLKNEKFKAVVSLRKEMVNSQLSPLTYSLGMDGEVTKRINVKANINKSYRIPDFNDLYWSEMSWGMFGNPNLKSEEGLNEEVSLNYATLKNKPSVEAGITAFNSNVTNWIMWEPISNTFNWTPMNVDTVWSRGLELNLAFAFKAGNLQMKVSGMYSYLLTTNESKAADSAVRHKQLIYVPKNRVVANLFCGYKNYSLTYSQNFTGKRFTNAEDTAMVKAFRTGDLIVSRSFSFKNKSYKLSVDVHLNNIWNEKYEVVQYYPTPGRNIQVGAKLRFER